MFDWLLPEKHAIAILKKDHDRVRALFDEFKKAESKPAKRKIVAEAIEELKIHAILEEEIFYPAVRKHVGVDLMNEADEEHHVAKLLIAELETISESNDHHDAKFTVLSESVRHHIKEEEGEMLPKARSAKIDFERLGEEMQERRQELHTKGIPVASEERLMAFNRPVDSPARAAHKKPARTIKKRAIAAKSARPKPSAAAARRKAPGKTR